MSTIVKHKSDIEEALSDDKKTLLRKLSSIFDPDTAIDFVYPKTRETRKITTIDDLKTTTYENPGERLQRLRTLEHYQTTTQSLPRSDLEASYQAFVRGQVGQQQVTREELEQFVRNSSDIDAAKRYFESGHDLSSNCLQPHLLFHSSKLNEQRAGLLKSAPSHRSLKQINENLSLQTYFPENLATHTQYSDKKIDLYDTKPNLIRPNSMHIEHKEKKYCIKFVKDFDPFQNSNKPEYRLKKHRRLMAPEPKNIEALLETDGSTEHGLSSTSNTSNIHRETFPPLSLSALREYRPTLTPSPFNAHPSAKQPIRKTLPKTEFIWEQSIVSPKHK